MERRTVNVFAICLIWIVVASALTTGIVVADTVSGGTTSVSNTGSAPAIHIADAVIDDSAGNSDIEIAFDATGEISQSDLEITVSYPTGYETFTPNTVSGTVTLTVPQDALGGGTHRFKASLRNASIGQYGRTNATSTAIVEVQSSVAVTGYSVANQNVYTGEEISVTATVENTGGTTDDITVALYDADRNTTKDQQYLSLGAGNTQQVSLKTSYSWAETHNLTINGESKTPVTVEDRVSVTDVSVSDDVIEKGQSVQYDVTLKNPTSVSSSYTLGYDIGGGYQSKPVSVSAESTKTVSLPQKSYTEPGEHYHYVAGESKTLFVLNDSTGTADLQIENLRPATGVVGKQTGFPVNVTNHGDASGVRNVTLEVGGNIVDWQKVYVEPGQSKYAFLQTTFDSTGSYTATIDGTKTVDVTIREQVVTSKSLKYVSGTQPGTMPTLQTSYSAGMVNVQLLDPNRGMDLSNLGVDQTTVFEVNLTVSSYTPRVLISSGQDMDWEVTNVSDEKKKISIRVKPAQFQYMQNAPRIENWNNLENDQADFSMDAALMMGISNANQTGILGEKPDDLKGLTIATDAQSFGPPRYYPGQNNQEPRLEIKLAGPHLTKAGQVNQGYYQAFLPDSLLNTWGVSDPSELTAAYSESENAQFTVTEVADGMNLQIDLHYSSGTVSISKKADSSSNPGDGVGYSPPPQDKDTTTQTTQTTTTDEGSETVVETATTEQTVTTLTTSNTTTTPITSTSATTTDTAAATTEDTEGGVAGFGIVTSLVALTLLSVLAKRRHN